MEVKKSGHGVYRLEYHVVWVSKYRRKVLNPGVEGYVRKMMPKLLRSMPGVEVKKMGFDKDHVHLIMVIPPRESIADVMGSLKAQSSKLLREKFKWLEKVYWKEKVFWSPGYFVSSVGVDEEVVRRYVEKQGREDLGQLRWQL